MHQPRPQLVGRYRLGKSDFTNQFRLPQANGSTPGHPHPHSAADRAAVLVAIRTMLTKLGCSWYAVSPSRRETQFANRWWREWFWARDTMLEQAQDELEEDDVLVMIDVDYHVDMNAWLQLGHPIVLYTVIPEKAARRGNDYAYRFEGNNLVYQADGGLHVTHPLWNYDLDDILIDAGDVSIRYEVARLRTSPDHYVVFLVPTVQLRNGYFPRFDTCRLQRRIIRGKTYAIVPDLTAPPKLSIALRGPHYYQAVSLLREQVLTVQRRVDTISLPKTGLVTDIATLLERQHWVEDCDTHIAATILCELLKRNLAPGPDGYLFQDMGTCAGQQTVAPLVEYPALFPGRSPDAEMATIAERINLHPKGKSIPPRKLGLYSKYVSEFGEQLIPPSHLHRGRPLLPHEVVISQEKPRQKIKHQAKFPWLTKAARRLVVRAFQKVETYPKPKAPRNISTVPYAHLVELSTYTLAMKRHLKTFPQFGPGKTPDELTAQVCSLKGRLMARDFSTYDGTITRFLNEAVLSWVLRWVHPDHSKEVTKLLSAEWVAKGKTRHEIPYYINDTRVTGSPTTADHNTLINWFVSYVIRREEGQTPEAAFNAPGIYYGDDSIEEWITPSVQERVTQDLGLRAKPELIEEGRPIPFLGRYFRAGTSIADPMRTLAKLHLSGSPAERAQAAINKAGGYAVTDAKTPVIGVWAKKLLDEGAEREMSVDLNEATGEEVYKLLNGAWPQEKTQAREMFIELTPYDLATILAFEDQLRNTDLLDTESLPWVLPNTPWPERSDTTVNGNHVIEGPDLSRYEQNSCFYEALVQAPINHPVLSTCKTGGALRYRLQRQGVDVPVLGDMVEEPQVLAAAQALGLQITVESEALREPLVYGAGTPVTLHWDREAQHYTLAANDVIRARRAYYQAFGTSKHSKLPAKMALLTKLLPKQPALEISPAPGYMAQRWPNPEKVTLAHYTGPGALPLNPKVQEQYEGRIINFQEPAELPMVRGTWFSDAANAGIAREEIQAEAHAPLLRAIHARWMESPSQRLVIKAFMDGPLPSLPHLQDVAKGPNKRNVEVYLIFEKGVKTSRAAERYAELQRDYVSKAPINADKTQETNKAKPRGGGAPTKSTASATPEKKAEAQKAKPGKRSEQAGGGQRPHSGTSGDVIIGGLEGESVANPVQPGGSEGCRPDEACPDNGLLRSVPVQELQARVDIDDVHPLHGGPGNVLGSGDERSCSSHIPGTLGQLRSEDQSDLSQSEPRNPDVAARPDEVVPDARVGKLGRARNPLRGRVPRLHPGLDRDVVAGLLMAAWDSRAEQPEQTYANALSVIYGAEYSPRALRGATGKANRWGSGGLAVSLNLLDQARVRQFGPIEASSGCTGCYCGCDRGRVCPSGNRRPDGRNHGTERGKRGHATPSNGANPGVRGGGGQPARSHRPNAGGDGPVEPRPSGLPKQGQRHSHGPTANSADGPRRSRRRPGKRLGVASSEKG
uniref:RNA replicase n=1 Tax=Riboviria sp. TaxID=2585031 RepID=A0A8K1WQE5_9VIRU|nr:MAG: hypothetical protein 2 [Riboviria sp.]